MDLSPRQRRALAAISDTFAPGGDGVPSASQLGVPEAIAEAIDHNPREAERKQLGLLLTAWDTKLLTAVGGGGYARFSALPPEKREAVLLSWADSNLKERRGAFHQLRRAVLVHYYALPGSDGHSPVWDAIGYPGPLGKREDAPPKPLEPLAVSGVTNLECDVVVVGSGAGGGTAAGVLSGAGLDVVVVEAGDYYDDEDFDGGELSGLRRMYLNAGGMASDDGSLGIAAGACLGGGTVINYSTSFPTPQRVREEWASTGVPDFAGDTYEESTRAVMERLGVNAEHSAAGARDKVMERGLRELGWHVEPIIRNVSPECDQGVDCGRCGFGCRRGAKRSTAKTWLQDASDAGARILVRTEVERVIVEGGAARGVTAKTAGGDDVTIRSRAVVVACGALHTPALLKRSKLENKNIGKWLRLHPVGLVGGVFDEDIEPWDGTMQARYSDQHADLDGDGYGVKYETGPLNPSLMLPFLPWRSGRQHFQMMSELRFSAPVGIIVRDRDSGEVRVGRDGRPIVRYRLSDYDARHLRAGIEGGAQILEAAGAQHVWSAQTAMPAYRPGSPGNGSRASFMADVDRAGFAPGQVALGSFHIMGSARMGGSPATSACTPAGETWEVRDLFVADASTFPTACGVNPMISIESTAHMVSRGIAARLA
jgi:choline dehydrogenase-like flavoprotein